MKIPYRILLVSLILCIGYLPNSTGASFEPAKTVAFIENDNPGNYSLLQIAIEHSNQGGLKTITESSIIEWQRASLFTRLMFEGHKFQLPFWSISLLFSEGLTTT